MEQSHKYSGISIIDAHANHHLSKYETRRRWCRQNIHINKYNTDHHENVAFKFMKNSTQNIQSSFLTCQVVLLRTIILRTAATLTNKFLRISLGYEERNTKHIVSVRCWHQCVFAFFLLILLVGNIHFLYHLISILPWEFLNSCSLSLSHFKTQQHISSFLYC